MGKRNRARLVRQKRRQQELVISNSQYDKDCAAIDNASAGDATAAKCSLLRPSPSMSTANEELCCEDTKFGENSDLNASNNKRRNQNQSEVHHAWSELKLSGMTDVEIRNLLLTGSEELHRRNAFFPEEVMYSPRRPRNFLGLPLEIRQRIYHLAIPDTMSKADPKTLPKTYHPAQRSQGSVSSSHRSANRWSLNVPNISLKFAGPVKKPPLAFSCRQIYDEVIGTAFAIHAFKLKIDFTQLDSTRPIAMFMTRVLLQTLTRVLCDFQVELRCNMMQWEDFKPQFSRALAEIARLTLRKATIKIRVFIEFPEVEFEAFTKTLPRFFSCKAVRESRDTWLRSYAPIINEQFVFLRSLPCVEQIHLIHLEKTIKLGISELYNNFDTSTTTVMTKESSQWKVLEGCAVWSSKIKPFVPCDGSSILDL